MARDPWPWEGLADHVGQVPHEHVQLVATAERAVLAAGAQRVAEQPWGLLLRSQFTPDVYEANQAVVTADDADPEVVLDAVDAAAADDGLNHRRVRVDVADLVDPFRTAVDARWGSEVEATTEVLMLAVGAPDRHVETTGIEPVLLADLEAFLAASRSEEPWAGPLVVRQMATRDRRLGRALGEPAALGVLLRDDDGAPVAGAEVRLVGPVAQVEEVHVLERHRGQGHGRRVTQAALELAARAGAGTVFLVADAEDGVWRLYARMGFATALVRATFTRSGPPAMGGGTTPPA